MVRVHEVDASVPELLERRRRQRRRLLEEFARDRLRKMRTLMGTSSGPGVGSGTSTSPC